MLTISTIPEALAELEKTTRRAWTDSELFDLAANYGIELHAAPPITARTTIQKFVIGEGMVEKFRSPPGHARLAVLFPWQVGQLWLSGETMARHPEKHNEIEDEYQWFTEPVRVTREQVRIKAATLKKMSVVWSQAQAGRWVENDKKPGDMRYQTGPDWMFPIVPQQSAPATDTALPAPAVAKSASNSTTPDPERRLARLRELGGNATYKRGQWKITFISALVTSEKSEGRKRSDEKTIRADLKEAAENEREARRANAFSGLGQR